MTSTQNWRISSAFYLIMVLVIVVVLAVISTMLPQYCINTPYQPVALSVNETILIPYHVDKGSGLFEDHHINDPSVFGYMIIGLTNPGSYHMVVSTNKPDDKVRLEWFESYQENRLVGDKFEKHYEVVTLYHFNWRSGIEYSCISDKNADCFADMELGNYEMNPMIQVYIVGRGSGDITITRTG